MITKAPQERKNRFSDLVLIVSERGYRDYCVIGCYALGGSKFDRDYLDYCRSRYLVLRFKSPRSYKKGLELFRRKARLGLYQGLVE